MRRLLGAIVWNLMMVFLMYQVARTGYWLENTQYLHYTKEVLWGGLVFDTSAILYTNVLWVLMMLFPWYRKENNVYHRVCKGVYLTVNGLALAMNLADAVYFPYTMRRTTTTVFGEFSNEGNLGSIIGQELFNHWYMVVLFIVVMVLMAWAYQMPRLNYRKMTHKVRYHVVCLVSLLLFIPLCIAGMRGGFTMAVRPITISNANQYVTRPTEAAFVLNTPFSLIRTWGKKAFIIPEYFTNEAEMERLYSPLHNPSDSLKSKRKNIVILIVESFGQEYIGSMNPGLEGGHYQGYTPFTDSLMSRSLTWQHTFSNGRKSIDGMPSILSSIPMFIEPFFLTPASMNTVGSLARELKKYGYHSSFFHGAENGSMGFQAFARATDFDNYYGRTEYNADKRFNGEDDFDGMWAIWDEPFLQFMATHVSEMTEPFFASVFTASSHHPFKIPEAYIDSFPEGPLPIHRCIRYTDHALRKFFETARTQPWYYNTIFVITADHCNQSDHQEYQTDLGLYRVPIIFFDPSGEMPQGTAEGIGQQIDIMPTILGWLGCHQPYIAFGCDLFHTPKEDTWAVNYNNGIYQYIKHQRILQFDGQQARALYHFEDDPLLKANLLGKDSFEVSMTEELKSIIQQYMQRMNNNQLVLEP